MSSYLSFLFNYSHQQPEISTQDRTSSPAHSSSLKTSGYIDLETSSKKLRKKVFNTHFRYAAYMYMGFNPERGFNGNKKGILISHSSIKRSLVDLGINQKHIPILEEITAIFIHTMGFKVDPNGNYYHIQTGTCFNLIYDTERKEIVLGFMGLNTHHLLSIDDAEKAQLDNASKYAAVTEVFGYRPSSVYQAIEIGKILKEFSGKALNLKATFIGHSHGGGLAQIASLASGIKAVIFNSRPIGNAAKGIIGEDMIAKYAHKITPFNVKGDWLTSKKSALSIGSMCESILGVSNIGKGYLLPTVGESTDWTINHGGFYRSFEILKEKYNLH